MSNVPSTNSAVGRALPPVLQLMPSPGIAPSQVKLTFESTPALPYASEFGEKSSIVLRSLGPRLAMIVYAVIPPSQLNLYDSVFGSSDAGALRSDPPQLVADSGITVAAPPGTAHASAMNAASTTEVRIRLEKPRDFSVILDVTAKVRPDKEFCAEIARICGAEAMEVLAG